MASGWGPPPPILSVVRFGILGGTFDPPHIAHLVGAEAAYRELDLDAVLMIPAGSPWQKAEREVTAARHRWEMTRLATDHIDYLVADDREVRRPGWTYTVDTLAEFPDSDEIVLILGSDAARGLPTWHRAAEVIARTEIAVIPRPGSPVADVAAAPDRHVLDVPALPVSGTELRLRARTGRSIRFLVPETVHRYIEAHDLYG
jgi:nicotinate-nucleotide adenylyltransferase